MGLSDRAAWATLIGIVLFGAGLRIYNLDSSLWYDEIKAIVWRRKELQRACCR
jgi:hypothetical protein